MSQSHVGDADTPLIKGMLRKLLVSSMVICSALTMALAQQAQSVKSSQPVKCGEKQFQLRLLMAEALIKDKNAKSLAIVLTPDDASASKVFGVYWIGAKTPLPTHRDDTSGELGDKLFSYGNGKVNKASVVESFFSNAKCSSTDPQVIGIQNVISTQGLLDSSRVTSITLRDVATELSNQGVSVKAEQVEDSTAGSLEFFKNLSDDIGFAEAIRRYLTNLLAAGGRIDDSAGTKLSKDDENELLRAKNIDLENKVKQLETEKSTFFGATPTWLLTVLPIMLVLSLGGITFFGLVLYHFIQRKSQKQSRLAKLLAPQADSEAASAQAVGRVQKELNEFQPHASLSGDGLASQEIAPAIKTMKGTLQNLSTDIVEMKRSVDSFNSKLEVRTKVSSALQNLWHRLYPTEYSPDQVDKLVKDVGEVIELHNWLRQRCVESNAPISQTLNHVQYAYGRLDAIRKAYFVNQLRESAFLGEILEKVQTRLARDAEELNEFKVIERAVREYNGKQGHISETVMKLIAEHKGVQSKLEKHDYPADLTKAVDAVVNDYQGVIDQVKRALPNLTGKIRELVTSLAGEYLKVEPEARRAQGLEADKATLQGQLAQAHGELEAGKQLVDEIALEFNFKLDRLKDDEQAITTTLKRLKGERESSVYLQLRLGLSSALIALEKTANANGSEECNDVVQALHLDKVKSGIQNLLGQMEECTGEQLWHKGLSEGFSQKWLHYLIRADLLLRTYYADQREFGFLRQAVSLSCSTILAALYEFQVEVVEVALLGERPKEMDTEAVYPGIRNLPAVRDKVRWKITNAHTQELVVDVTSFPYFVKGVQENRGRAALANPSAWVQH